MQLEVGAIIEGKVTGITKFGAFVELPEGKTGMVHISEVASTYVKEISDHLTQNQMVKVKVLNITPDGKVSLSIKKCQDPQAAAPQQGRQQRTPAPRRSFSPREHTWQPKRQQECVTFEDMMLKFKQTSEDKMSDLKRNSDTRRARRGQSK